MYTKIDSEDVLISYFNFSTQNKLSFKKLNEIRDKIENNYVSACVDVTYSSIRNTVIKYHDSMEIDQFSVSINRSSYKKVVIGSISSDITDLIKRILENEENTEVLDLRER